MTAKPILDTRTTRQSNLYPIFILIRHGAKSKYVPTGYKIPVTAWRANSVAKAHKDSALINSKIANILHQANTYYADCVRYGRKFDLDLIGTGNTSHSFNDYLEHRAKQFDNNTQIIMAKKVRRLRLELIDCFGTLYFDAIDTDACRKYEAHLIKQENTNNTRIKKFKLLGQFYGQAVRDEKATLPNFFKEYKIIPKPVKKDKLTIQELASIEAVELTGPAAMARDLFLFSYYCKGARFENCVTLKRTDIHNGRISFKSNKGNKYISVKIHARLQAIINRYKGPFVFPYLTELPSEKDAYIKKIGSLDAVVNRNLKVVAALAEVKTHLTFHIARHSFASHLMTHTDSIHVIKESLGHSDYRVTEVYLKSLGDSAIDSEMEKLYGL